MSTGKSPSRQHARYHARQPQEGRPGGLVLAPSLLALALALAFTGREAQAQPTGGTALHGSFSTSTSGANTVITTTNGPNGRHSAINWQSFNVPGGTSTYFQQPGTDSTSINRVLGSNPSEIFGRLGSNGRLVLVNPAGIAVGPGAVVDTAGFVASTLPLSESDAIGGLLRFSAVPGLTPGPLSVAGRIVANQGDVVLVAPQVQVSPDAVIHATDGAVILAAGQKTSITGRGLEGIAMEMQAPTDEAVNFGTLEGSAVGIFAGTLRHSGMINADQIVREGGRVVLKAAGDATVSGTISAQGTRGGSIDVFGHRIAVQDGAVLDASGTQGGGSIRVGGDYQGSNPDVPNAQLVLFHPEARIRADASDSGQGGRVILWSDDTMRSWGEISARGGPNGGDGGFVEVSGKEALDFRSRVDTRAPQGKMGSLLLDPGYIDIRTPHSGDTVRLPSDFDGSSGSNDAAYVIAPSSFLNLTSNVTLWAYHRVEFFEPVTVTSQSGDPLSMNISAARVAISAPLTMNGDLTLTSGNIIRSNDTGNGVYIDADLDIKSGKLLVDAYGPISVAAGKTITAKGGIGMFGGMYNVVPTANQDSDHNSEYQWNGVAISMPGSVNLDAGSSGIGLYGVTRSGNSNGIDINGGTWTAAGSSTPTFTSALSTTSLSMTPVGIAVYGVNLNRAAGTSGSGVQAKGALQVVGGPLSFLSADGMASSLPALRLQAASINNASSNIVLGSRRDKVELSSATLTAGGSIGGSFGDFTAGDSILKAGSNIDLDTSGVMTLNTASLEASGNVQLHGTQGIVASGGAWTSEGGHIDVTGGSSSLTARSGVSLSGTRIDAGSGAIALKGSANNTGLAGVSINGASFTATDSGTVAGTSIEGTNAAGNATGLAVAGFVSTTNGALEPHAERRPPNLEAARLCCIQRFPQPGEVLRR